MRIVLVVVAAALIGLTACEHRSVSGNGGSSSTQTGKVGLGLPF